MGEKTGKVVVDTYALLAMVFDELTEAAREAMHGIYAGRTRGLLPSTVGYEFTLHWLRGRVPGLKSREEVLLFLKAYFEIVELDIVDYVDVAGIKARGDRLLSSSRDPSVSSRRLSLVDSSVIHVALRRAAPIVTGDKDLRYVAEKLGVQVIW